MTRAREHGRRSAVRSVLLVWALGSAAGLLVMSLPERGGRVVSLSATHGPSLVDLVGVALLVAAWLPVVALLWSGRAALRGRAGVCAAVLGTVGLAVLWTSVVGDTGREWMVGVALLTLAQLVAVGAVTAGAAR